MIKFAAAQPLVRPGAVKQNAEAVKTMFFSACDSITDVVVMPELCLSGATCGDLFLQTALQESVMKHLDGIITATAGRKTVLVFGLPLLTGGKVFNCAVSLHDGKVIGVTPKRYLSLTERRWFSDSGSVQYMGVCESGQITVAGVSMNIVIGGAFSLESDSIPVLLNPSAEREVIRTIPINPNRHTGIRVTANAGFGESTTDFVYAGGGFISQNNNIKACIKQFEQGNAIVFAELDETVAFQPEAKLSAPDGGSLALQRNPFISCDIELTDRNETLERILNIQAAALATRLLHSGSERAVLGLSGGLDSALALLVCVRTMKFLGRDSGNITSVIMPGFGTSGRTAANARILGIESGSCTREISIVPACKQHFSDIGHSGEPIGYAFENTQARERTQILFDIANMESGIVVGSGDMTELALGFTTYNGDHMSSYGVNAGIPKTIVRALVLYEAEHNPDLSDKMKKSLISVVETPISPELLPVDENGDITQKTESIVGSYELNDFFLYHVLNNRRPKDIIETAKAAFSCEYLNDELNKRLLSFYRRFVTQQFKRSCLPDAPQIFDVTLSPRGGLIMPSDASYTFFEEELS